MSRARGAGGTRGTRGGAHGGDQHHESARARGVHAGTPRDRTATGVLRVGTNWYADRFGLALQQELLIESNWVDGDVLRVSIDSDNASGVDVELRFHIVERAPIDVKASAKWRYDIVGPNLRFAGNVRQLRGVVRVYEKRLRDEGRLGCLFALRGDCGRGVEVLPMGGFDIELPPKPDPADARSK